MSTLAMASRRTAGASSPVIHATASSMYAWSASVRPPSREKTSVVELTDVEPGNVRSSASSACAEAAYGGRNAVWSVIPSAASDGAKKTAQIAAATQATTITNRKRYVRDPSRSNIVHLPGRAGAGGGPTSLCGVAARCATGQNTLVYRMRPRIEYAVVS